MEPDFFEVTVTIKVTPEQRAAYAREYSMDGGVADDMASRIPSDIRDALSHVHWLREFTGYSVSRVR